MGTTVHIDELGPIAEEIYDSLLRARALRGRIEDRPTYDHKTADADTVLRIEEDLVIVMGRMAIAGIPIPAMPAEGTAPEPPAATAKATKKAKP